jgi:hypothetical protein
MAIYKIFPEADASIYSSDIGKNTGLDEILEIAVKNSNYSVNGTPISNTAEDIRRALVKFSSNDIAAIKKFTTGSWNANLRLFLSEAENLTNPYTLEFKQINAPWTMGTGKFSDYPDTTNGVCWSSTSSYQAGVTSNWPSVQSSIFQISGGGSWNSIGVTQSFSYKDEKDINANITSIIDSWFSGSAANYGILIKHTASIENNALSYIVTNFYSMDTHTIYTPTLEMKWDDSVYIAGNTVTNSSIIVNITNNLDQFKYGTEKYRMQLSVRDQYPTRQFSTSSVYLINKTLPSTSYWAIQDVKTEEMVIDFDTRYTKISSNGTGSYFDLYMNGLQPERYYKALIKTVLPTNETIEIDNNLIFKIVR